LERGEKFIIKISDFGLSTFVGDKWSIDKHPVKWTAPEVLNNVKASSTASDIWSYGVTLWEIYSYGAEPYLTQDITQLYNWLLKNPENRLEYPDGCSIHIYEIMKSCWNSKPELRPKPTHLLAQMKEILNSGNNSTTPTTSTISTTSTTITTPAVPLEPHYTTNNNNHTNNHTNNQPFNSTPTTNQLAPHYQQ
jgi:hypothetical protein